MFCREQVAQLRDERERIEQHGAHVVVIGNGTPAHARMFAEDEGVPFTLRVDPEMKAYRAAGLRRGIAAVFSRRSLGHTARAIRGGFRQTRTKGDPWQNGGVFIITPEGRTLMQQRSREAGDHANMAEVLEALRRAAD